jgi:hypothetical protein
VIEMSRDDLEHALDLRSAEINPEVFVAALAVQHIRRLIAHGGSDIGRPDDDCALYPQHLEIFLARAIEMTQRNRRFEGEWRKMHQTFPRMAAAWEQGQALFQQDLSRAMSNAEQMEYLSMIDFAVDCNANITARNAYPHDQALQNWAFNGYMMAWRQHYFTEEESGGEWIALK